MEYSREQLIAALNKAAAAGDNAAANEIADYLDANFAAPEVAPEPVPADPTAAPMASAAAPVGADVSPEGLMQPNFDYERREPTGMERAAGIGEAALTMGSSILAEPVAGIAGIYKTLTEGADAGAEAVKNVRESWTYTPTTKEGQGNLQAVGEALAPIGEALEGVSSGMGDFAYDVTGSPAIAATFYSAPTAILEIAGVKGLRGASSVGKQIARGTDDYLDAVSRLKNPLRQFDEDLAGLRINKAGIAVPDTRGRRLLELELDPKTTALVRKATPETRAGMAEMFDIFKSSDVNDVAKSLHSMDSVIGKTATKRLVALGAKKKGLVRHLDTIVKNELQDVTIPLDKALEGGIKYITDSFSGVKPVLNSNGSISLRIADSSELATKAFRPVVNELNKALELINTKTGANGITGASAHALKRNLDDLMSNAKATKGMSQNAQVALQKIRSSLNNSLRDVSENYASVNDNLSSLLGAEEGFKKFALAGDYASDSVSDLVGASMRVMKGDSASGVRMAESLKQLDAALAKVGIKFADDHNMLMTFRDNISNAFKLTDDDLFKIKNKATRSQAEAFNDAVASGAVGNLFGAVHDVKRMRQAGLSAKEAARLVKQRKLLKDALEKELKSP